MDERIARFIIREHIMHIAIREDEGVYNASCFYAFDRKNLALIFKSDPASHHAASYHDSVFQPLLFQPRQPAQRRDS